MTVEVSVSSRAVFCACFEGVEVEWLPAVLMGYMWQRLIKVGNDSKQPQTSKVLRHSVRAFRAGTARKPGSGRALSLHYPPLCHRRHAIVIIFVQLLLASLENTIPEVRASRDHPHMHLHPSPDNMMSTLGP